jgi:hypothetical protein
MCNIQAYRNLRKLKFYKFNQKTYEILKDEPLSFIIDSTGFLDLGLLIE